MNIQEQKQAIWSKIKVGDRIKVRTSIRYGYKTVTRKVIQIEGSGIGIRCFGYDPFWLNKGQGDKLIENYGR